MPWINEGGTLIIIPHVAEDQPTPRAKGLWEIRGTPAGYEMLPPAHSVPLVRYGDED
jgi:hypothetical protein